MKLTKPAALLLWILLLVCSAGCSASARYRDGSYTAAAAEFAPSGWKETMEITIENGNLISINWDAVYKDDSIPIRKKQYSKSGLYGMMAAGSVAEWYDQAVAAEQYVLEHGIDALLVDQDGYTDAVSGCTIHVTDFELLLRQCLKQASR